MWNNSSSALTDIEALAYSQNVPESERVLPGEASSQFEGASQCKEYSFLHNPITNPCTVMYNQPRATISSGGGRGALLKNREVLHRDNLELGKQLRLATGLGNSNTLIEYHFTNSPQKSVSTQKHSACSQFNDDGDTVNDNFVADYDLVSNDHDLKYQGQSLLKITEKSNLLNKGEKIKHVMNKQVSGLEDTVKDEVLGNFQEAQYLQEDAMENVEDTFVTKYGDWVWEKRTSNPAVGAIPKKNVALKSIARQLKKADDTKQLQNETADNAHNVLMPSIEETELFNKDGLLQEIRVPQSTHNLEFKTNGQNMDFPYHQELLKIGEKDPQQHTQKKKQEAE